MGIGIADRIRNNLAVLQPVALELVDQSEAHRGHAGWRDGGETHFDLTVVSAAFAGKSRVQRQRLVLGALKEEFEAGLHALSIQARAPGE
ncbi:MAG: BolA family transcriptional regulator [Alphaproteobacteria bacterium]|nr:BolA family transcriptional regulator [Alphaproteobacteria bacterium]